MIISGLSLIVASLAAWFTGSQARSAKIALQMSQVLALASGRLQDVVVEWDRTQRCIVARLRSAGSPVSVTLLSIDLTLRRVPVRVGLGISDRPIVLWHVSPSESWMFFDQDVRLPVRIEPYGVFSIRMAPYPSPKWAIEETDELLLEVIAHTTTGTTESAPYRFVPIDSQAWRRLTLIERPA